MSFRKTKAEFSVPITSFPESLHPLLKEIDGPEGNGALETDELTEVFEMYAAAKKANEEGCIALKSLPQELQKTLEVFDVDGDGTVGTAELAYVCSFFQCFISSRFISGRLYVAGLFCCLAFLSLSNLKSDKICIIVVFIPPSIKTVALRNYIKIARIWLSA